MLVINYLYVYIVYFIFPFNSFNILWCFRSSDDEEIEEEN